jgi:hypothetical protein
MRAELRTLAKTEGVSINQYIVLAVAERIIRHERLPLPKRDDDHPAHSLL